MESDHIAKNIPFTVIYDGQSGVQAQPQETIIRSSEELATFFNGSPPGDIDAAWDMDSLIAVALREQPQDGHPVIKEITLDKSDTGHPAVTVSYSITPADNTTRTSSSPIQVVKCQHLDPSATAHFRMIGLEQQVST
jgi:hypothetical protein